MKNNAKKIVIDGIEFDSKAEGNYYLILKEKKEKGEILSFSLQPSFVLLPAFTYQGEKIQGMKYTADFWVNNLDESFQIIEIKGYEDPLYKMRIKLFKFAYPDSKIIVLAEAPKKYGGGFILLSELKKLQAAEKRKKNAAKKEVEQTEKRTNKGRKGKRI